MEKRNISIKFLFLGKGRIDTESFRILRLPVQLNVEFFRRMRPFRTAGVPSVGVDRVGNDTETFDLCRLHSGRKFGTSP